MSKGIQDSVINDIETLMEKIKHNKYPGYEEDIEKLCQLAMKHISDIAVV